jgi:beta-glucanase (GH16 family)
MFPRGWPSSLVVLPALLAISLVRVSAPRSPASTGAPAAGAQQSVGAVTPGSGPPSPDYRLVWSDEFDGTALDSSRWDYRGLGPRRDAVNVKEAVALDGEGHLVLTTTRAGNEYHTAIIGTEGKFEIRYGYFEARVRMQSQRGHWSAFWLQSPTMGARVGDPGESGAEIDVFEYLVSRANRLQHTLHWDGYGKDHKTAQKIVEVPSLTSGWHTVGFLWSEKEYAFSVDGRRTWRTSEAVSHRAEYLILSLEVGTWAGDIATATLPDRFLVDYVRAYQRPRRYYPYPP